MKALGLRLWVLIIPNIEPLCSLVVTHPHIGFQKNMTSFVIEPRAEYAQNPFVFKWIWQLIFKKSYDDIFGI